MERSYQVQTVAFVGPLDMLLQLIEKEKLAISEVSLASVTDQFLSYIGSRDRVPLLELSNFLHIAAKLILIKSRSLLPSLIFSEDEEESIADLQLQLELYALYQNAAKNLQTLFEEKNFFPVRDKYLWTEKIYLPPKDVTPQSMQFVFTDFLNLLEEQIEPLPTETLKSIITLEQRIGDIQIMIAEKGKIAFSLFIKTETPKEEKIVSFLALLELIKQKFIFVEQLEHFSEMNIQKI